MADVDRKQHWENIYQTKELTEVSWYQPVPETSLHFLKESGLPLSARIIDIGGGDSFFADHLLDLGYTNISVLDISSASIERAKKRLGPKADKIKWIVADASNFEPIETYDFWHDRAAFHFLTSDKDITHYIKTASANISSDGVMVVGTFSEQGPKKCSGIEIKQYSEDSMTLCMATHFEKINCLNIDHTTPFGSVQNFTFCSFKKLSASNSI